jgi:hypothetical protein
MEIINTMGGTLTYEDGRHRYEWTAPNGIPTKVDHTVSSIAGGYPVNFGVASGWAAKMVREHLVASDIPTSFDGDESKLAWAKDICGEPNRQSRRAASIGTEVHSFIESTAHGLEPDLSEDEDVAKCQKSLGEWFAENIAEVLHTERRLYSLKWNIAGTVDMVARLRNGQIHVIDWKGATDLKASLKHGHVGQLAAYRSLLEEAGEHIDGCTLVRFSRATGKIDPVSFGNEHYATDLAAFEAALMLARYQPRPQVF